MKKKLLFWIDFGFIHFGIAKALQDAYDSDFFAIIDINDKAKEFFETQNIVKFKNIWYYLDETKNWHNKPNIKYLKSFEEKYKINLWSVAYTDRAFFRFNKYYNFSYDNVLSILEQECRFFERILDEVEPDFLLLWVTNAHNTHLLHQICKAREIEILMFTPTRFGNRFTISHDYDKLDERELDNVMKLSNKLNDKNLSNYLEKYDPQKIIFKKSKLGYQSFKSERYKAVLKFFISKLDESYKIRYSYMGRTKWALLKEKFSRKIEKYRIENFMKKNFIQKIDQQTNFIYFSLHSEPERALLIGAPYFDDQFSLIMYISKSIPIDYKLYVKDHPAMRKFNWRPISYYSELMKLPNIEFLHPSVERDEILKNCSLVMSVGGTTAVEAAFFKKPSIIFQENDLPLIPSIHRIKNLDELPNTIRSALNEKIDASKLNNYLKIIDTNTFFLDLESINTDFAYTFGFKGPNIDGKLPSDKVKQFLDKNKIQFKKLALEHIKKIEQYNNKNEKSHLHSS